MGGQEAFLFVIAGNTVLCAFIGYCGSTHRALSLFLWIMPNRARSLLSCADFFGGKIRKIGLRIKPEGSSLDS